MRCFLVLSSLLLLANFSSGLNDDCTAIRVSVGQAKRAVARTTSDLRAAEATFNAASRQYNSQLAKVQTAQEAFGTEEGRLKKACAPVDCKMCIPCLKRKTCCFKFPSGGCLGCLTSIKCCRKFTKPLCYEDAAATCALAKIRVKAAEKSLAASEAILSRFDGNVRHASYERKAKEEALIGGKEFQARTLSRARALRCL
eukprot:m.122977 g.122977  ORF g.122977 m.122977 type:complete len:199 (+) comp37810_c0_seq2:2151-2747(+)